MTNSKQIGDEFEMLVLKDLESRGFEFIVRNVHMKGTGCEVDFVAKNEHLVWHVEAKGGKAGYKKRPGAKRTDNVKKSIANAALIKTLYPDYYYVIYFSSKPNPGSYSQEMLKTAIQFGIVNEVIYLAYNGKEL